MRPSADLIWRAGAPARHQQRVERTKAAALEAAGGDTPLAIILLSLDLHGVGGKLGVSGGATRRLLHGGLGSGRWNAGDGAAYRAAAESALVELINNWAGDVTIMVSFPDAKTVAVNSATDFAHVPVADICAANGEEFLAAAAGDKLVTPGKRGVYDPIGVIGPVVVWADDPGRVGEAYDWLAVPWGIPLDLGNGVEWDPLNGIRLPVAPWRVHVREVITIDSDRDREPIQKSLEAAGLFLAPLVFGNRYMIIPQGEDL